MRQQETREVFRRIHAAWKHHAPDVGLGLVQELNRAFGRPLTCGISVEQAHDATGKAREQSNMVLGKGRTECRHGYGKTRFMHGHDIGVSLAHDGLALGDDVLLGLVERKEVLALVEHLRLSRVEILRLRVGENPAAEANGPPLLVVDGKHHPVIEAVGRTTTPHDGEVDRLQLLEREPFA